MRRHWFALVMCWLLVAGCTPSDGSAGAIEAQVDTTTASTAAVPEPTTDTPSANRALVTTTSPEPVWIVGAEPLPLRSDGLGEILPTPAVLVERELPTMSPLPSPTGVAFESTIAPIGDDVRERMGPTWAEGCPVALDDLRHLTVTFWGFDGGHHRGELIVHHSAAADLAWVFEQLHAARFPIEEMRLITGADLDAAPTGDGNNTASFVCRAVRGGSSWSEHARGLAVDINPFHNPYQRGEVVLPELASSYLDRSWHRPGMISPGDAVTEAFAAIGWRWGGEWSAPDYMHFSATGR